MFKNMLLKIRNKVRVEPGNIIIVEDKAWIRESSIFIRGNNNQFIVKSGARVRKTTIEIIGENCLIEIGENTLVGHNSYLSAKERNIKLTIGKNCGLSRNVKLMTSDGHDILQSGKRINQAKKIHIMDHVWLADGVTILKGVTVGKGSIVGIDAVLTKSIGDNVIAAGNPAKVIKEGIHYQNELTY